MLFVRTRGEVIAVGISIHMLEIVARHCTQLRYGDFVGHKFLSDRIITAQSN